MAARDQIRTEVWRGPGDHPGTTLGLRVYVETGDIVPVAYQALAYLMERAGFQMIEAESVNNTPLPPLMAAD